jgi:hypothetical protein
MIGLQETNTTDNLQTGMFRFCGCGLPKKNLAYIKRGLEFLSLGENMSLDDREGLFEQEALKHFGTHSSMYFFWYWADMEKLTDHGSSIGASWLSPKGKYVLSLLEQWKGEQEENDN